MQYVIEVGYKDNILDALGESINKDIHDLGIKLVSKIKSVQIYKIDADLNFAQIEDICDKLLIDPITQEYVINKSIDAAASEKHFVIEVWFKKGVTDAVSDTVITGIKDLGFQAERITVHTGAKYILYGKLQTKEVKSIASKLLANNIVQDYFIGTAKKHA
ncbi:MAG: phosphoribosylformylglycinamidine synthase subunit PurS [Elusimicrobia bacterium]|nr:phosphoribosylformylglycinamidine synthase subunit PurS [Elusimicrobiota bacterium]